MWAAGVWLRLLLVLIVGALGLVPARVRLPPTLLLPHSKIYSTPAPETKNNIYFLLVFTTYAKTLN